MLVFHPFPPVKRNSFKNVINAVEDLAEQVIILNKGTVLLNEEMETAVSHIENKVWQCDLTDMEEINRIKNYE